MGGINAGPITPTKLTLTMNEPDTAATGVLTSDTTNPADGDTVTIGSIVYEFKTALTTDPATVPYEVLIGADTNETLANLQKAINATGTPGTEYSVGTEEHPDVTCGDVAANAVTVTAKVAGLAGNDIAKAESSSHLDWDGTGGFLTGGDINDIDTIAFGSSGYVNKILVTAPQLPGTPTFVLRIKDADGTIILESSALNENALSSVTVGMVLVSTDIIEIDVNADLDDEYDFIIVAR